MLKKTASISAYNGIQSCCACTSQSSNPSSKTSPHFLPSPRARPDVQRRKPPRWRKYATVRDGRGPDFRDNMNWPCRSSSQTTPSPYEIFELDRGAAYTKHKYYELVKLYHPDKTGHHGPGESLTHMERLERYRLVVQAHEILSDPVKRRAYDAYGAGWGELRPVTKYSKGYPGAGGREYGFGPGQDDSPFGNATWEDWERWYRRKDNTQKQAYAGTYINPNAFASFVILMAVLTGVLQATRAGQYSQSMGEKVNAMTEETNQFMMARAQHFTDNRMDADKRVKHFLERRDPSRYGLKDEEEETYKRHFARDHIVPGKPVSKSNEVES